MPDAPTPPIPNGEGPYCICPVAGGRATTDPKCPVHPMPGSVASTAPTPPSVEAALDNYGQACDECGRDAATHPFYPRPERVRERGIVRGEVLAAHEAAVARARQEARDEGMERAAKYCDDTSEMWRAEFRRTSDPVKSRDYAERAETCRALGCSLRALRATREGV